MDAKTFPQEVGIDDRAVHYQKGCYLGQEAMAKIHFRGKVNRRLRQLESEGPLRSGAGVLRDAEKVGAVTSASGHHALALLRHDVEPPVEVLVDGIPAKVVA